MAQNLQGNLVKKAHAKIRYTDEMMAHLHKCSDPDTGPMYFMENFLQIQHPTKGEMPFEPYPYQERLIEAYNSHRFSISMLPRQTGKTNLCFWIPYMVRHVQA